METVRETQCCDAPMPQVTEYTNRYDTVKSARCLTCGHTHPTFERIGGPGHVEAGTQGDVIVANEDVSGANPDARSNVAPGATYTRDFPFWGYE